jgi:hypothetical protein
MKGRTKMKQNKSIYHWKSLKTGEIQSNIFGVIGAVICDLQYFHLINFKWKYSRKGF